MSAAELRARVEALSPEQSRDPASVIELADACFAFEGGVSQAFGISVPASMPERPELRARCLELMRQWVPLLDAKTLKALEWRVKDRRTPLDLSARKAELKPRSPAPDLSRYKDLPPLPDFSAVAAFVVSSQLAIGESPADGVVLPARPGVWLAYFRECGDDGDVEELLAVHASCVERITDLRQRAERLDEQLPIDGARMALADADAAKDEDFVEALYENNEIELEGRAAQVFLDGDGHAYVHVVREGDLVVLALIELH